MARPRQATVLKILTNTARKDRTRDDEAVRAKGKPEPLPIFGLSERETELFRWLMDNGCLPAVHGRIDAMQIAEYCKLVVQRDIARDKVRELGHTMEHPQTGRLSLQPYFQAWMALDTQLNRLGNELALTPAGRLRHAPPADQTNNATSWDDIAD